MISFAALYPAMEFTFSFGTNATTIPLSAITREKELKEWRREWKVNLIERDNPNWEDLYEAITR